MMVGKQRYHWRACLGALAVAGVAFGLSLRLEGAAPAPAGVSGVADQRITITADEAKRARRLEISAREVASNERVSYGNLADIMAGNVQTYPVIRVDYRDDDATRMREAGLLEGALPLSTNEGGVAGGNCSFDIDCQDTNRCTIDTCNFPAGGTAGSGTCVHTQASDGNDGATGNNECPNHFGLACGGCNDGLYCNGEETCASGICVDGPDPCPGVCNEDFNICQANACVNAADCTNVGIVGQEMATAAALICNGAESCVSGVCRMGVNPCGSGATCFEKRCSMTGNPNFPHPFNEPCITDTDCFDAEIPSSTCSISGPVCLPGRCCTGATEPVCARRHKNQGKCTGGGNPAAPCRSNADCTSNVCNFAGGGPIQTCDNAGGIFYGGDDGTINGAGGAACGTDDNLVQHRCPKYSAGIAPTGPYSQILGPVSNSTQTVAPFGGPLNRLGDDYALSNPGVCVGGPRNGLGCGVNADCPTTNNCNLAGPSFILLDYLRFVGGSPSTDRMSIEFYSDAATPVFVEDIFFSGTSAFGVYAVLFDPPILIPAKGWVAFRVAPGFSPSAKHVYATTDATDVGVNNPARMWLNAGPVNSNFGTTGILALELDGAKAPGIFGACCNDITGACTNGTLPWECKGAGNNFQGPSSTCPANCGTGACCAANGGCSVTTQGSCTGTFQGFGTDCDTSNGNWGTPIGNPLGESHCCPQPNFGGRDHCEDVVPVVITAPPQGEVKVITLTGNNTNATSDPDEPSPSPGIFGDSCFPPSTDQNSDPGWWEAFTLTDDCTQIYVDHCCSNPIHRPAYRVLYDSCPCGSGRFTAANVDKFQEPPDARGGPYCGDEDNAWQSFGKLPPGTYYYPIYSALAGNHNVYQLHIVAEACTKAACCLGQNCDDGADDEGLTRFECDALGGVHLAPPNNATAVTSCVGTNGSIGSTCFNGSCCTGPGECVDVVLGQKITKTDCDGLQGSFVGFQRCEGSFCASTPNESCNDHGDCPNGDCVDNDVAEAQPTPCPVCEIEGPTNCQRFEDVLEFTTSDRSIGDAGLVSADNFQPSGTILNTVCAYGFYLNFDPDAPPEENDCSGSITADQFRIRVWNADATGRVPNQIVGESLADDVIGGASNTVKAIFPGTTINTRFLTNVWIYQLKLDTPITGLIAGNVYFLELSNDLSESNPVCKWNWMQRTPVSSSFSFTGTDAGYDATFETPTDNVWCVNMNLDADSIGGDVGACCTCDGVCSLKTLLDCGIANGVWDVTKTSCAGVVCPVGAPGHDTASPNSDCTGVDTPFSCCTGNGTGNCGPIPISDGVYTVSNQCATTDGWGPIESDFGESQLDFDLWYHYTVGDTACNLIVSECATGTRFDSMIAVYANCAHGLAGCDPTICPEPALMADPNGPAINEATLAGIGQDESCTGVAIGGPGVWISQGQIGRDVVPGECLLLRIGGFPGGRGTATLDITCEGGGGDVPQPVAPNAPDKTRFISFEIPNNEACTANATPYPCCTGPDAGDCNSTGETAIRIVLDTLHVVNPPYSGGNTVSFNSFAGQSVYVGPPATYTENGDPGGTPFKASFTQCTPHFRDWNTVGLLHVTGPQINPSSVYQVEHVAAVCNGNIGSGPCSTGGNLVSAQTEIKTTRWGDVRTPYNPPDPSIQPDISDVGALVDKFRNAPGAPIKARGLLAGVPGNAWGAMDAAVVSVPFGFGHISACVDAFRGAPYPFRPGKCTGNPTPPATGACGAPSECGGANGAGPCVLYCP